MRRVLRRPPKNELLGAADPRKIRVSDHFVLADFLGCYSVYTQGLVNRFQGDDLAFENVKALCNEVLEPLIDAYGPCSVSYGYISPEVSRRIVKYQDPDKPSHHRFDLGAAADVCFHKWVAGEFPTARDLALPPSAVGSPIALAHAIEYMELPYSRMITYSESPYLCLAVSAREVVAGEPRRAFYENRYTGKPRVKPDYRQYASDAAKNAALEDLQNRGLPHPWQGGGFPTYHGGGHEQYHHMRVSKYTMVSDWLFDLQSISNGAKNIPCLNYETVQDAFAAAGLVYDWMVDYCEAARFSIVGGYVSHVNPYFDPSNDWRTNRISLCLKPPANFHERLGKPSDFHAYLMLFGGEKGVEMDHDDDFLYVGIDVEEVLNWGKE